MIDEKKLIEDIHEYFKRHIDNIYCKDADGDKTVILNFNADIHRIVENQPKVGEWILCSERLPEEKINPVTHDLYEYPVTADFRGVKDVRYYKFGKGHWWHGAGVVDHLVIAWMPLPEPYREEKKDE